ncbi:polyprenyl synthetase family protein [Candidatus Oscillochloris fontis]|uniref:polyprenyl synthetase family protein n=1 Tax=Candidatus Oscillochloris fontis TaxID=2496868 RepID=UPI00101D93DB|nr:polyprenyl synthetase family protein [Candidatus Oscillochloris fontis]
MAAYQFNGTLTNTMTPMTRASESEDRHGSQRNGRSMDLLELFERANLTTDLRAVEELLIARSQSRSSLITEAGVHTVRSGGKRLRAAMALLAAQLGTYQLSHVIHAAASAELIHAASLVHDDLVDQAARRRGRVTVHARWDNDVALMVGDYFFALASAEMSLSPDPRIITFYAQAVQVIVEGELSPVMVAEPTETALRQYFYKTGAKTAVLFEAACKAGMAAGGGDEAQIAALAGYGFDVGVAFQIVDDVLDFIGNEATLGKPAGNDLRQGTITLPLIYALQATGSPRLRAVVEQNLSDDATIEAAIGEVLAAGGATAAIDEARRYVDQAINHLNIFPDTPARRTLITLAQFVLEREA